MRLKIALSAFLFCVIAFASCSIEKRIYEKGYHISWLHPKPNNHLADVAQDLPQDLSKNQDASLDVAQGCSKGASQDLPQDLSKNLSQNQDASRDVAQGCSKGASQDLPQDLSKNLSKNLSQNPDASRDVAQGCSKGASQELSKSTTIQSFSDTIIPPQKTEDYFGEKDYSKYTQNQTNKKRGKPQNITELKKETSDNFKVALFGFVGYAISLAFLSMNNWSTLDNVKSALFFIILGVLGVLLFLIYFPIAIFRLFKLIFLKIAGKPDNYPLNQASPEGNAKAKVRAMKRFGLWLGNSFTSPIGRLKLFALAVIILLPIIALTN